MTMKKIFTFCLVGLFALSIMTVCKTSEKNYREAYEKAVAKNDRGVTEFEETIYNRYRKQVAEAPMNVGDKTINTKILRVKVTDDGGGIREWLKKYSVVAGEFKQKFNANSLRKRFVEAGYPRTFLVENGEPYYYVVIDSSDDITAMSNLADSIAANPPFTLKEGYPFIMQRP